MTRKEFLTELETSLEGKLAEDEVREILNDYDDIFENSIYEGKTEEAVVLELGSPAKIARKILDDAPILEKENVYKLQINKGSKAAANTASLSSRFGAYVLDSIIGSIIILAIIFSAYLPFSKMDMVTWSEAKGGQGYEAVLHKDLNGLTKQVEVLDTTDKVMFKGSSKEFSDFLDSKGIRYPENFNTRKYVTSVKRPIPVRLSMLVFLVALLGGNLFNSIITWKYNGYTIGKKLFKIKVEKIDGTKISFIDAILRESVIKSLGNVLLGGLINLASFIWACFANGQNTLHDKAVKTRVMTVKG